MIRHNPNRHAGRLRMERLETRVVLSANPCFALSHFQRLDVSGDGAITALDALRVINQLTDGTDERNSTRPDTESNGTVTALDALRIINAISEGDIRPLTLVNDTAPGDATNQDRITRDMALAGTACWPVDASTPELHVVAVGTDGVEYSYQLDPIFIEGDRFEVPSNALTLIRNFAAPFHAVRVQIVQGRLDVPSSQRNVISELDLLLDRSPPRLHVPDTLRVTDTHLEVIITDGSWIMPDSVESLSFDWDSDLVRVLDEAPLQIQVSDFRVRMLVPIQWNRELDASETALPTLTVSGNLEDVAGNRVDVFERQRISVERADPMNTTLVFGAWDAIEPEKGYAFDSGRPAVNPAQTVRVQLSVAERHFLGVDTQTADFSKHRLVTREGTDIEAYDPHSGVLTWYVSDSIITGPVSLRTPSVLADYGASLESVQVVPTVDQFTANSVSRGEWNLHGIPVGGIDVQDKGYRFRFVDDSSSPVVSALEAASWNQLHDGGTVPITGFQPVQFAGSDGVSEIAPLRFAKLPNRLDRFAIAPEDAIFTVEGHDLVRYDFRTAFAEARLGIDRLIQSHPIQNWGMTGTDWIEGMDVLPVAALSDRVVLLEDQVVPETGSLLVIREQHWVGTGQSLVLNAVDLNPIGYLTDPTSSQDPMEATTAADWLVLGNTPDGTIQMQIEMQGARWRRIDVTTGFVLDEGDLPDAADLASGGNATDELATWQYDSHETFGYWDADSGVFTVRVVVRNGADRGAQATLVFDAADRSWAAYESINRSGELIDYRDSSVVVDGWHYYQPADGEAMIARQRPHELGLPVRAIQITPTLDLDRLRSVAEQGVPTDPMSASINSDQVLRVEGQDLTDASNLIADWISGVQGWSTLGHGSMTLTPLRVASNGTWAEYLIPNRRFLSNFRFEPTGETIPLQHVPSITPNSPTLVGPTSLGALTLGGLGEAIRVWIDDQLVYSDETGSVDDGRSWVLMHRDTPVNESIEVETRAGRVRYDLPTSPRAEDPWTVDGVNAFEPQVGAQVTYLSTKPDAVLAGSDVRLDMTPPEAWLHTAGDSGRIESFLGRLVFDAADSEGKHWLDLSIRYQDGVASFHLPPASRSGTLHIWGRDGSEHAPNGVTYSLEVTPTIVAQAGDSQVAGSSLLFAGHGLDTMSWMIDGIPAFSQAGPYLVEQELPTVEVIVPSGVSVGNLGFRNQDVTATSPPLRPWWVDEMPVAADARLRYPSLPSVSASQTFRFSYSSHGPLEPREPGELVWFRTLESDSRLSRRLGEITMSTQEARVLAVDADDIRTSAYLFGGYNCDSLNLLLFLPSVGDFSSYRANDEWDEIATSQRILLGIHQRYSNETHAEAIHWGDQSWSLPRTRLRHLLREIDAPSFEKARFAGPVSTSVLFDRTGSLLNPMKIPKLTALNLATIPDGPMRIESVWGTSEFQLPVLAEVTSVINAAVATSGKPTDPGLPSVNPGQAIMVPSQFRQQGDNLFFTRRPGSEGKLDIATWTMGVLPSSQPLGSDVPGDAPYGIQVPHDAVTGDLRAGLFANPEWIQVVPTLKRSGNRFYFVGAQPGDLLKLGKYHVELNEADVRAQSLFLDLQNERFGDVDPQMFEGSAQLLGEGGQSAEATMPPMLVSIEVSPANQRLPSGYPFVSVGETVLFKGINLPESFSLRYREFGERGVSRFDSRVVPATVSPEAPETIRYVAPESMAGSFVEFWVGSIQDELISPQGPIAIGRTDSLFKAGTDDASVASHDLQMQSVWSLPE
ncbi:MAG: dockerin type I domain-containing protein [Planctomycetota bacterium]